MRVKDEIKSNWRECFQDSSDYMSMYFSNVYRDEDAIYIAENNHVVSSLLLQNYIMKFHGDDISIGYIAGACTRRHARGRGLMSELMVKALRESALRGNLFLTLIPAHEWLYDYYSKFGLTTSIFVDIERYTSLHSFTPLLDYEPSPLDEDSLCEAFSWLENRVIGCGVIHSALDFKSIIVDNRLDGGHFVAVNRVNEQQPAAMAFATVRDNTVVVNHIAGVDEDACTAALSRLRSIYPDKPFKVLAMVDESRRPTPRAMARIIDVDGVLQHLARTHPKWRCRIRVSDSILEFNNGIWRIANGQATLLSEYGLDHRLDFDVSVETLTSMVFSGPSIGDILNFPTARPYFSLMLD